MIAFSRRQAAASFRPPFRPSRLAFKHYINHHARHIEHELHLVDCCSRGVSESQLCNKSRVVISRCNLKWHATKAHFYLIFDTASTASTACFKKDTVQLEAYSILLFVWILSIFPSNRNQRDSCLCPFQGILFVGIHHQLSSLQYFYDTRSEGRELAELELLHSEYDYICRDIKVRRSDRLVRLKVRRTVIQIDVRWKYRWIE